MQPDLILTPFGEEANPGTINDIPESLTPSDPVQSASWKAGFPLVTMTPLSAGGIPPRGQDVNGALRAISRHSAFLGGGGQYKWSSEYVAAKGGYSIGDVIQANDGLNAYVSLVDGNTANFNTTPASIGTSWQIYSGTGLIPNQATEASLGIARIATQAQINAGVDDSTISTPKKIKAASYITEKIVGENCKLAGFTAGGSIPYMQRADSATFLLATRKNTVMEGDTAAPDSPAGSANERVANTRFVTAAIAASVIANPPIGVNQSWQDMTASRAKGVTYTNNTGRPIDLFIAFDPSGGSSVLTITGHPFGVADNNGTFVSMIIPAGGTYSLSDWGIASPMKWLELR